MCVYGYIYIYIYEYYLPKMNYVTYVYIKIGVHNRYAFRSVRHEAV